MCHLPQSIGGDPSPPPKHPPQGEQRLVNPYTQESLTIDPRSIAQRILDVRVLCGVMHHSPHSCTHSFPPPSPFLAQIRVHLAKEWQEDLKWVRDENADMLRESLLCSLKDSPQPEGKIDDDGRPI